jgi:Ras family protein U
LLTVCVLLQVLIELAKYKEKPVTEEEASRLASQLGAQYVECSALTQKNLKEVFDTAILTSLTAAQQEKQAGGSGLGRSKSLLRKSKRSKSKDSTAFSTVLAANPSTSTKTAASSSPKKAGWKKFCCFM